MRQYYIEIDQNIDTYREFVTRGQGRVKIFRRSDCGNRESLSSQASQLIIRNCGFCSILRRFTLVRFKAHLNVHRAVTSTTKFDGNQMLYRTYRDLLPSKWKLRYHFRSANHPRDRKSIVIITHTHYLELITCIL